MLSLTAISAQAAPTIENQAGVGGQTSWLESFATAGENNGASNTLRIVMLVKHDPGREVTGLRIDDDWNGNNDAASAAVKSVSAQQPTISGGYAYSRVNYTYEFPTANTGLSCGFLSGTRRTDDRVVRVRARLDNTEETATTTSQVKFTAAGQCTGPEDFAYLYSWGATNFNKQLTPGQSATFTYTGDDPDTTGDSDFEGVFWRLRNSRTGATTSPVLDCDGNGDNAEKSTTVTFPDRGHWVVEAELRDGGGCTQQQNNGYWFPLGSADVNDSNSPTISLSATRPVTNGNTVITANLGADDDSGDGGRPEYVEWDLDNNGSFETTTLGDTVTGLTTGGGAGAPQKTINTAGDTPGVYTVRARVTDNGAMAGADNIRRTSSVATTTYTVNTPPTATPQTVTTESDATKPITLSGTDPVNGDSMSSFNVTSQPTSGQGTVTPAGSGGAARSYNPPGTFAGQTSFQFTATDSFQGTSAPATVTVDVTPQTQIDSNPPANSSSSDATFTFSSPVTTPGVTFECRIDSTLETDFTACTSPRSYMGLEDGSHTFDVRARIGSLIDPTPASYTWVLDGTGPDTTIDTFPPDPSNDNSPTFTFSSDEATATFECRVDSNQEVDFAPCTDPYTFGAAEGQHVFDVRAVDEFGRKDPIPASYTWRVDNTAPTATFDATPSNPSNSASAHFEFSSSDLTATFECRLDPTGPGGWAPCTSPQDFAALGEGTHTFEVRATDPATNTGAVSAYSWVIDLTTPETTLLTGPDDPSTSSVATFTFESNDPTAGFECRIDSSAPAGWEECSSPELYADLGDGSHTFEVRATDAAGNKDATPGSQTWTIDTAAPETTIDDGPSGATSEVDAELDFSSDDPGADFECRLDGAAFASCSPPVNFSGLAPGSHTFRVRAADALGNVDATPAVRTWTIDTASPTTTIDSAPSDPTGADAASFEFSADEDATFECRLDSTSPAGFGPCTSPQGYSGLDDGDHTLEVRATDSVGNVGGIETHTWEVDTTAPDVSITSGMPPTTSASAASFSFTSTDGSATFQCRIDGGGWQNCAAPKAYSGLDEGSHTFDVRSRDDVGNLGAPVSDTWTIVDSDAPDTFIDSAPDDPMTGTSASFTFSSDEANSSFECALDTLVYSACTSPRSYTGLAPGSHTFRVRATDTDTNTDQSPAVNTWTISQPAAPPATPAAPGASGVAGTAAKSPVITAATGKLKLGGSLTAGSVTCGSTACAVKSKAKVKIDGVSFRLRVKLATSIPADAASAIVVVSPKAARTALASAGKGVMTVKLAVTSSSGNVAKKIKLKVKK